MTISIIFWILAAICISVMDKTSHHFHSSIFKEMDQRWWNGEISWKNKYKGFDPSLGSRKMGSEGILSKIDYPVQLTDAWHLFKTLMIVSLAISVLTFRSEFGIWMLLTYGIIWNITFSLFYNKILKAKI